MLYCPGSDYGIVNIKDDRESKAKRYLQIGFNVVGSIKEETSRLQDCK
ncbi:hypothetical protein [Thalassobellus citreus]